MKYEEIQKRYYKITTLFLLRLLLGLTFLITDSSDNTF